MVFSIGLAMLTEALSVVGRDAHALELDRPIFTSLMGLVKDNHAIVLPATRILPAAIGIDVLHENAPRIALGRIFFHIRTSIPYTWLCEAGAAQAVAPSMAA